MTKDSIKFAKLQNILDTSKVCVIVGSGRQVCNNFVGLHRSGSLGTSCICCGLLFIILAIFCEHSMKGKCLHDLLLHIILHICEAGVDVSVMCTVSNMLIL
jgi:hypothetical protein